MNHFKSFYLWFPQQCVLELQDSWAGASCLSLISVEGLKKYKHIFLLENIFLTHILILKMEMILRTKAGPLGWFSVEGTCRASHVKVG